MNFDYNSSIVFILDIYVFIYDIRGLIKPSWGSGLNFVSMSKSDEKKKSGITSNIRSSIVALNTISDGLVIATTRLESVPRE